MSLLSVTSFIIILLISSVRPQLKENVIEPTPVIAPSVQTFREFVANTIKEQSSKLQMLLKKIQTNAQTVLEKIDSMKQDTRTKKLQTKKYLDMLKKYPNVEGQQVESPVTGRNFEVHEAVPGMDVLPEARSFNNYLSTGYGTSGNSNYNPSHVQAYHHHSIGFDPINIVVSMSLLSFLLQAIQGLLNRTRLPTPVVEARSLNSGLKWLKKFEENNVKLSKTEKYLKNKFNKNNKYYR